MAVRDSQRSKLYAAERAAWKRYGATDNFGSTYEVQEWVNMITRSRFWKSYVVPHFQDADHPDTLPSLTGWQRWTLASRYRMIQVRDGRARRSACGSRLGYIKMPRWSRTKWIVLHEIAHVVQTEWPAHGRQFARIYLDLVRRFIAPEAAQELKRAYIEKHVRSSKKRVATSAGNPEALKRHRYKRAAMAELGLEKTA